MSRTPEEIVRALCANMSARDVATIEPLLADDIEYLHVGLKAYRSKQAILDHYGGPSGIWEQFPGRFEFLIRNLGVSGNRVYTERVDVVCVNGRDVFIPLLGIFEIENDKVKSWRDYADMIMVQRLLRGDTVTIEEGYPPGTDEV